MATEFELKYAATSTQLSKIRAAVPGEYTAITMETTYYDTPGRDLSARKWTLRRRLENGVSVCTLKTPAGALGRNEWEVEQDSIQTAIPELCKLGEVVMNGAHDAPHILNLSIPGVPTQNSLNLLQDKGICVSAGSACAKGHRSHVLTAMKLAPEVIDGSFRVSICKDTTQAELDKLVDTIREKVLPMRR